MLALSVAKTKFLSWSRKVHSPRTTQSYESFLERFYQHVGDVDVAKLSPAVVLSWCPRFHGVVAVQRLTSWCHREARLLKTNPLAGMKKPRIGQRCRVLSRGEITRVLRGCRSQLRAVLLAMRESLARPQEVRVFKWTHLRLPGGRLFDLDNLVAGNCFFFLNKFKGVDRRGDWKRVRLIPVSPRLGRLLARLWGAGQDLDQNCFLNSQGEPWTPNAVRCGVRRLRARQLVPDDGSGENWVAYSLRHSGATELASQGIRDFVLAELMGHASTRTTARYVHVQPLTLSQIVKRSAKKKDPGQRMQLGGRGPLEGGGSNPLPQ